MGKLYVLSRSGDTRVEWGACETGSSDPKAEAAIREAERIFRDQVSRGASAFKLVPGQPAIRIDEFDPRAEEVLIIPRVVGG